MPELDPASRIVVTDDPDRGLTTLAVKDTFLNYSAAEPLKAVLKDVVRRRMDGGIARFAVDLSSVEVMDSCGLSVLIGLKKLVEPECSRLALAGLTPMVRRLFSLTKLDQVFTIHATIAEAQDALVAEPTTVR